jgi:hypothetical protein
MREGRTQLSAKDSVDPNCHLAGLPPEIWIKILQLLPLDELWKTARPVCAFWNAVANDFARSVFYKDSKCEISTLFDGLDGFKHYERDYLLPLEPKDKINVSRLLPKTATKAQINQLLVWRRLGASTHEWTSFRSPDNIWPRVIQYHSAFGTAEFRMDYDGQFYVTNGDGNERVFSRNKEVSDPEVTRADWRIRVKTTDTGAMVVATLPLWQLIRLLLTGSIFSDSVNEIPFGNRFNGDINSYYVWDSEGEDETDESRLVAAKDAFGYA